MRIVRWAVLLSLDTDTAAGLVLNVGSGRAVTIREVAARTAAVLGTDIAPEITGEYRVGDVRHCFADITLAERVLGYRPQVSFEDGLIELAGWLQGQTPEDRVLEARAELASRGLTV